MESTLSDCSGILMLFEKLHAALGPNIFGQWVSHLKFSAKTATLLTLTAPDKKAAQFVSMHYGPLLLNKVREIWPSITCVKIKSQAGAPRIGKPNDNPLQICMELAA